MGHHSYYHVLADVGTTAELAAPTASYVLFTELMVVLFYPRYKLNQKWIDNIKYIHKGPQIAIAGRAPQCLGGAADEKIESGS